MWEKRSCPFLLMLIATVLPLHAQINPSAVSRLGLDKDYLFPPAGFALRSAIRPASTEIDHGELVAYQSFQGPVYTLTEFRGKNVSLLLPRSWLEGLTFDERRTLQDRTDLLYEHLKELIGGEPAGNGLLQIALVPQTCGWGCAYIGAKGVEVLDADWSLGIVKSELGKGDVPGVFSHEMTHNFDLYWPYLTYTEAHAWTAFLDAYVQIYTQQGFLDFSPTDWQVEKIWERWDFYARDSEATWQKSVRDADPALGVAHVIWGGLQLRFAQLHGANAIRRAMQFLKTYSASHLPPVTPEEKEDLRIEALAAGAGLNLSCYADAWRWQASASLRARMAAAYGFANPFCQNGTVVSDDELVVRESGDFPGVPDAFYLGRLVPVRIEAKINANDNDYFEFRLPRPGKVSFMLGIWDHYFALNLYTAARDSILTRFGTASFPLRTNTSFVQEFLTVPNWTFAVVPEGIWAPGVEDSYIVRLRELANWPVTWGSVRDAQAVGGGYRLQLNVPSPPEKQPAEVRFWVSGVGFVGRVPYSASASYDWRPGPEVTPGTYGYRAQLFSQDTPVSIDTAASYFRVTSDTTPPVITPQISGTLGNKGWYRSSVRVTWSVSDPESGIASSAGCGETTLTADTAGVTLTCSATNGVGLASAVPVTVKIDKTPPAISGLPAPGCTLWPPNHKMVQVGTVRAADALSGIATFNVTGASNEPSDPKDPDILITKNGTGGFAVQLRAERLGGGQGRVYTLNATATDAAGNTANAVATCKVPHDQGN